MGSQIEKFTVWALEIILRHHVAHAAGKPEKTIVKADADANIPEACDLCPTETDVRPEQFLAAEAIDDDFLSIVANNYQTIWSAARQAALAAAPDTAQLQQFAAGLLNLPSKGSVYRVRLKRAGDALRATHAAAHPLYQPAEKRRY